MKIKRMVLDFSAYLKWRYKKDAYESVYFYTLHKCASTLFSGYLLQHVEGLRLLDYAASIYHGEDVNVVFEDKGYIIGPIRISANPFSEVYKRLVEPASSPEFIHDKTAIFLIRDPRDVLVSSYYSFGYSHGFSPVNQIREAQEALRAQIQQMTMDEYILSFADQTLRHFETIRCLDNVCGRSVVLKYEDMIDDFEYFSVQLTKYLNIKQPILQRLFEDSRPKQRENIFSHRRSGKAGGFRNRLMQPAIDILNAKFGDVLEYFQYEK